MRVANLGDNYGLPKPNGMAVPWKDALPPTCFTIKGTSLGSGGCTSDNGIYLNRIPSFSWLSAMATVPKSYITPQQYLAQERKATFKSQYFQGELFAMAGASREHNLIVANLVGEVRNALKDRRCEVYPSDMRVKVAASGFYTYPDASVVCDTPEFADDQFDTLINPTVLFEVLSESTESYDRGGKFRQYREIASLKEYVMISQDRASVECYLRQSGDRWLLKEIQSMEGSVTFDSIQVTIPLAELYRNIRFEAPLGLENSN